MKKILYVGLLYNYGKQEEGYSYENMNIEAGLHDCVKRGMFAVDCYYPDQCQFASNVSSLSLEVVIERLSSYDAIFHVAFNESLDLHESIAKLALKQDIPVIQWDCDSSWRFQNWILPRRDRVSHFVTTHSATVPWYEKNGMRVIKSQWAGSPLYKPSRGLYQYDCSFVGQKHGQMPNGKFLRSEIIDAMYASDIRVELFGNYWNGYPHWRGYLKSFEEVINVFDTTRVNLNLSNPWHHGTMPQIKGRHFEIPQCRAFQITTPADDLASYFVEGEEIVIAGSVDDLIDKTKYYITHSHEREAIAAKAQLRMLKDHQWHHRFEHIFKEVGI